MNEAMANLPPAVKEAIRLGGVITEVREIKGPESEIKPKANEAKCTAENQDSKNLKRA